mmetsp:Transcript_39620/g.72119  ORF Transcript_39620/g.72119 Transcript_39620/m.72119 type:complete len:115 (+) Transcript_39620:515-859(+)
MRCGYFFTQDSNRSVPVLKVGKPLRLPMPGPWSSESSHDAAARMCQHRHVARTPNNDEVEKRELNMNGADQHLSPPVPQRSGHADGKLSPPFAANFSVAAGTITSLCSNPMCPT